ARVGDILNPARGVIGSATDQDRVRAGGDAGRHGEGAAAVSTVIRGSNRPVDGIVKGGDVGNASVGRIAGVGQAAGGGLIVETVTGNCKDDVAVAVISQLGLTEDIVAGDVAGVGPVAARARSRIAAAVGGRCFDKSISTVIKVLHDHATGFRD